MDHFKSDASHSVGFLCSGGDSCGMNAPVRAITRVAIARGLKPYAVYEGFQGLIDAGDKMRSFSWDDVGRIIHVGGTILGSSRSAAFRTIEGRRAAVRNMTRCGVDALIAIGGDGSLMGADTLRSEWRGPVSQLVDLGASLAIIGPDSTPPIVKDITDLHFEGMRYVTLCSLPWIFDR
ncbi:phosphofructokinase, partial [Gonapodya prolifera JEL478]